MPKIRLLYYEATCFRVRCCAAASMEAQQPSLPLVVEALGSSARLVAEALVSLALRLAVVWVAVAVSGSTDVDCAFGSSVGFVVFPCL